VQQRFELLRRVPVPVSLGVLDGCLIGHRVRSDHVGSSARIALASATGNKVEAEFARVKAAIKAAIAETGGAESL
jgi:hypothetical protein